MDFQTSKFCVYDLEVYPNFFLFGVMAPDGTVVQCETVQEISRTLAYIKASGYELAGFNSLKYDDPVTGIFLLSGDPADAYAASVAIISKATKPWDYPNPINSVDLMPLLPGRMSLKQVGIRLMHKRLQELPIAFDKALTEAEKQIIRDYNINDLQITQKLKNQIQAEIDLRGDLSRQYGLDLRSKGDAGIAEVVITQEISATTGVQGKALKEMARGTIKSNPFVTVPPPSWWDDAAFMAYGNPTSWVASMHQLLSQKFNTSIPIDEKGRMVKGSLNSTVYMDDMNYQMGVGGLHSIDGPGMHTAPVGGFLIDVDVASYYPAIMLTQSIFPRHMGQEFGRIFKRLVDQRLVAKKAGDKVTADRLKITINGTYGKTSDPYSAMYDPQCTAGVTVTGQIALLLLIAMLADQGLHTVSANTDGITVRGTNYEQLIETVNGWEQLTGFDMEFTEYLATYQLDVNNYLAVKTDKSIKGKGSFAVSDGIDLRHSLMHNVCAKAVKKYLTDGTKIADTIRATTNINDFLITHAATKDFKCYWKNKELGKLVRFYKSSCPSAKEIMKANSEKSQIVPMSENCIPVQDLPGELPLDIHYDWYVKKAEGWLEKLTQPKLSGRNQTAYMLTQIGLTPAGTSGRAHISPGTQDWNAVHGEMGIGTGKKASTIAVIEEETQEIIALYRFDGKLPSRTRAKIGKDTGKRIVYGANIPLGGWNEPSVPNLPDGMMQCWLKLYYLPSELKKAGVVVDETV